MRILCPKNALRFFGPKTCHRLLYLYGLIYNDNMEIPNFISGYWDKIFLALIIALVTVVVARVVKTILKRELVRISRTLGVDETTYALVRRLIVAVVYLLGFMAILSLFPSL